MTTLPNLEEPAPPPADELYADVPGVLTGNALDATVAEYQQGADSAWRIDSPELAEWALAKYAEAAGDAEQLRAQRDAQMERAQAWYARVVREPQRFAAFLRAHLEDYALRQREAGKGNTLVLPNGEVPTRKGADPCVDIADEDAVVAWALKHAPDIVTTTHKVKLGDLRAIANVRGDKVATAAGEVIPGTFVRPAGEPYVPDTGPKPY
jgi:hypothetical protein